MTITTPRGLRGHSVRISIIAVLSAMALQGCEFLGMDALSVVAVSPDESIVDIDTLEAIDVYFSADAHRKLTERSFSLQENGAPMRGSFSWPSGDHLRFTPVEGFRSTASYDLKITSSAEDVDGNSLECDFIHSFRGNKDSDRPYIASFLPEDLSVLPDARPVICITFSEPMDISSVIEAFSLDPHEDGYIEESADKTVYRYVLAADLSWHTAYTVSIRDTACDAWGNSLGKTATSSFFVGTESIRPQVLSVFGNSPPLLIARDDRADDAETITEGLEKDTDIAVRFSEPMDSEPTAHAVSISPGTWKDPEWDEDGVVMTLHPEGFLETGERYTLAVASEASDRQGNRIGEEGVYTFMVSGAHSRRPIVSEVRFLNSFDENGLASGTVKLVHAGAITLAEPFNEGSAEVFFDVYLVLADEAVISPFDFIEYFTIRGINVEIDPVGCNSNGAISFHALDVPPDPGFFPASSTHVFRYVVNIDNSGTNKDAPGYIVLSLDPGISDSLGNTAKGEWSMMVTTTN